MRRARRIAVIGISGVLAFAGTAATSAAAPDPNVVAPVPGAPATAALDGAAGLALAAAGCYGQTDQPHPSTHVPGTVNVQARTVCPGFAVYVSTALYRDRW